MHTETVLKSLQARLEAVEARLLAAEAARLNAEAARSANEARLACLERIVYACAGTGGNVSSLCLRPKSEERVLDETCHLPCAEQTRGTGYGCASPLLRISYDKDSYEADVARYGRCRSDTVVDGESPRETRSPEVDCLLGRVVTEKRKRTDIEEPSSATFESLSEHRVMKRKRRHADDSGSPPLKVESALDSDDRSVVSRDARADASTTSKLRRRRRRWRRSTLSAEKALEPKDSLRGPSDGLAADVNDADGASKPARQGKNQARMRETLETRTPERQLRGPICDSVKMAAFESKHKPPRFSSVAAAVKFVARKQEKNAAEEAGLYNETIRGHARAALDAEACKQCEEFYRAAAASDPDPVR